MLAPRRDRSRRRAYMYALFLTTKKEAKCERVFTLPSPSFLLTLQQRALFLVYSLDKTKEQGVPSGRKHRIHTNTLFKRTTTEQQQKQKGRVQPPPRLLLTLTPSMNTQRHTNRKNHVTVASTGVPSTFTCVPLQRGPSPAPALPSPDAQRGNAHRDGSPLVCGRNGTHQQHCPP